MCFTNGEPSEPVFPPDRAERRGWEAGPAARSPASSLMRAASEGRHLGGVTDPEAGVSGDAGKWRDSRTFWPTRRRGLIQDGGAETPDWRGGR